MQGGPPEKMTCGHQAGRTLGAKVSDREDSTFKDAEVECNWCGWTRVSKAGKAGGEPEG